MLFQISFRGVGELHFHTPAVDGMHAFECFSATGTSLGHLFLFLKVRADLSSARTELGIWHPRKEYQLFKQHCTGNEASLKRSQQ